MIKKWSNRILMYALITIAVAVMGYYIYASYQETNNEMATLKSEGTLVFAEMIKLNSVTYTDVGSHYWGYVIPDIAHTSYSDGATITTYTKAQAEEMNYLVEVYYMYREDGTLVTYDKVYVDGFTPWPATQSILLWAIGGIMFLIAMYYAARNIIAIVVLKKGEQSIGMFEEAFHGKMSSNKYYKVKYTFTRDGEQVTAVSPAIYDAMQVEKLKDYLSFNVRYLGKWSFIDQRL